ncbi:MAG TPA: LuxR C-terminal-related transcriptional regulator [Terriglobales bacterium]
MQDLAPHSATIRVLVADNTPIYTQLLAGALQRDISLDVTGSSWDSRGLIDAFNKQKFDVIVISANLQEEPLQGFETLRELRAMHPGLRAVMLLDSSKREMIVESFRAGARGIFTRNQSVDILAKCVRCVHDGQIWADSEQMAFAVEALSSAPSVRAVDANGFNLLSKRELEVVRSLAEGLTNREIAEKLGLSQHTVKNYLFRVFDKLGVSSRVELLFMTLSQASAPANGVQSSSNGQDVSQLFDDSAIEVCERAAIEGMPGAQLRLAQMYSEGREVPADLPMSYMWYLVCEQTNQNMQDSITLAKRKLAKLLTTDEIMEAQTLARERLSQVAGNANSGVEKQKSMGTEPKAKSRFVARA